MARESLLVNRPLARELLSSGPSDRIEAVLALLDNRPIVDGRAGWIAQITLAPSWP